VIVFVTQRPRARLDLLEQFIYFGQQESGVLAQRYLDAVDATFLQLAAHPRCGVAYDSGIAGLTGLRRFPVRDFENYLVFYLPRKRGVDIIRVLHGARDVDGLFSQEET